MKKETICLNENFSTTKLLTKEKPVVENRPEDKFETVLFLSEGVNIKILTRSFNMVTQRTVERWIKQLEGGSRKMYEWYCTSVDSASFMENNK